jgi:tight adherence protein B
VILNVKISRRSAAFDEQLPNVLQLVAGSLQTGFSLAQALDGVVREDTQPAAGEFARALAETRLGVDLDVALDGVADRLQSADLRWVIMAVRIQRETGGNLAEVLRNTVATMRERAFLRRQVRTLSAEGRLSAYILLGLPVVVGGWLFYSNPSYMRPLYTTFFGISMLVTAGVLFIAGAFWMRNLINIKV